MTRHKRTGFVVGYLPSNADAREAIRHLRQAGFSDEEITLLPPEAEEPTIPEIDAGDRMRNWGLKGAGWGLVFGILIGAPAIFVPEEGVAKAWALAILASGIEGAILGGGVGALLAGFVSVTGWMQDHLSEQAPTTHGEAVLVARGSVRLLRRAQRILREDGARKIRACH